VDLGIDGISEATEIGSGGSASVYRATQEALGREVAIKIFHVHFGADDETERRRFRREQLALGKLSDLRGIVPLYASGLTEVGRPYIIMPFYANGSLQDRLDREGPIPWPEACDLMVGAAAAVQRAHDEGVLHRDLKPANIMVDRDGDPVVGDFGIARLVGSTTMFQSRALSTTPAFAPPEVFAGGEPTAAVDIYGLGASLFALVDGSPAFVSESGDLNVLALMRRVETQPVPDLRARGIPHAVAAVLERSMAKDPSDRQTSAADWADEIEAAVASAVAAQSSDAAPDDALVAPTGPDITRRPGEDDQPGGAALVPPTVQASDEGPSPTPVEHAESDHGAQAPSESGVKSGRTAGEETDRRRTVVVAVAAATVTLIVVASIAIVSRRDGDDQGEVAEEEPAAEPDDTIAGQSGDGSDDETEDTPPTDATEDDRTATDDTSVAVEVPQVGGRLADVREAGVIRCGARSELPGFAVLADDGQHMGFDADFCRVVAAAVLGDASAVEFVDLTASERFTALRSGDIDVLVRNTTWTASRDGSEQATFLRPTFYDGQGIMVRVEGGFTGIGDSDGAVMCVIAGGSAERELRAEQARLGLSWQVLPVEDAASLADGLVAGSCDAISSDVTHLISIRASSVSDPDAFEILPDLFTKEPLAPAVADGDSTWAQAVEWAVLATVQAEEFGITSQNVTDFIDTADPVVQRFLGVPGEGGAAFDPGLGLPADFAFQVVSQVGNYGEIFERHLTPMGASRGVNRPWTDGGLLYSPPFR
jgi:general L-amino acid transport system substrate-binding protein